MEFLKPRGIGYTKLKQQLLTVGDAAGNLHVYDVPQNLWRPLINERNVMSNFLEREMKVISGYCIQRRYDADENVTEKFLVFFPFGGIDNHLLVDVLRTNVVFCLYLESGIR